MCVCVCDHQRPGCRATWSWTQVGVCRFWLSWGRDLFWHLVRSDWRVAPVGCWLVCLQYGVRSASVDQAARLIWQEAWVKRSTQEHMHSQRRRRSRRGPGRMEKKMGKVFFCSNCCRSVCHSLVFTTHPDLKVCKNNSYIKNNKITIQIQNGFHPISKHQDRRDVSSTRPLKHAPQVWELNAVLLFVPVSPAHGEQPPPQPPPPHKCFYNMVGGSGPPRGCWEKTATSRKTLWFQLRAAVSNLPPMFAISSPTWRGSKCKPIICVHKVPLWYCCSLSCWRCFSFLIDLLNTALCRSSSTFKYSTAGNSKADVNSL